MAESEVPGTMSALPSAGQGPPPRLWSPISRDIWRWWQKGSFSTAREAIDSRCRCGVAAARTKLSGGVGGPMYVGHMLHLPRWSGHQVILVQRHWRKWLRYMPEASSDSLLLNVP